MPGMAHKNLSPVRTGHNVDIPFKLGKEKKLCLTTWACLEECTVKQIPPRKCHLCKKNIFPSPLALTGTISYQEFTSKSATDSLHELGTKQWNISW